MNGQDRPSRHPSLETAVLGTEAVLYDERSGTVHHLNASACAVWLLLDGRPVSEIIERLAHTTGGSPSEISPDVLQIVAEFWAAELLDR